MNHIVRRFYSIRKNAKQIANPRRLSYEHEIKQFIGERSEISVGEWCELRANLLQNDKSQSRLDTMVLQNLVLTPSKAGALAHTKQYFNTLAALNVQPSLTNYDYLVQSYCRKGEHGNLTQEEQTELVAVCNAIMRQSEMILPVKLASRVVEGLCLTDQWKQSLSLLTDLESKCRDAQSEIAAKAFSEGEIDLGFQMLDESISGGLEINQETCDKYWTYCQQQEQPVENIERMLSFVGDKRKILSKSCIAKLHELVEQCGGRGHFTEVNEEVLCSTCNNSLHMETVSDDEFHRLREAVMSVALIGDNVYQKSTPEEVIRFMKFIEMAQPYDVVLDGLNVAFCITNPSPSNEEKAERLALVVQHFVDQGKTILIIGRKHMNGWPRKHMETIRTKAFFFPVDNVSYDDIFTLYAALYSGPNTQIVTNDFMRGHSYLLGAELKEIFTRWHLTNHLQIHRTPRGLLSFAPPMKYKLCCHKSNGHWHIPYVVDEEYTHQLPDRVKIEGLQWSCVQLKEPMW